MQEGRRRRNRGASWRELRRAPGVGRSCGVLLYARVGVVVGGFGVLVPSNFLLLVVRPGAPSSVLAPSSDARSP